MAMDRLWPVVCVLWLLSQDAGHIGWCVSTLADLSRYATTVEPLTGPTQTPYMPHPYLTAYSHHDSTIAYVTSDAGVAGATTEAELPVPEVCYPEPSSENATSEVNNTETCDTPFRTYDGSCNHPENKGQVGMALARFIPPDYNDGHGTPRNTSVDGKPLPNARLVSRTVHSDKKTDSNTTIFLMAFGQYLDHEIMSTPNPIEDIRDEMLCCGPNGSLPSNNTNDTNSECFPILFPGKDPDLLGECMEFIRSRHFRHKNGTLSDPRENENIISSFIDGSNIYGSTFAFAQELRQQSECYLLRTNEGDYPPNNDKANCVRRDSSDPCFLTGDDRVNEQPTLTLLNIIFLRYHNILSQELKKCHNKTDSPRLYELVYQQARAIVVAVLQNIVYSEFLPLILGQGLMNDYNLTIRDDRAGYDPTVDPRVFSSFATAAFRFGHSQITQFVPMNKTHHMALRNLFFTPYEVRDHMDDMTEAIMLSKKAIDRNQAVDHFFTGEITNHLFEKADKKGLAFDLVALNIHRGRDHGLPPYNKFREELKLRPVKCFNDSVLGDAGSKLHEVYCNVDDIDLFPGGMAEAPIEGGMVGETFGRLIAEQFRRIMFGDRFFFSFKGSGFTDEQVREIRKVTLSHLLCLTTGLKEVQDEAFKVPRDSCTTVSCKDRKDDHPSMELFKDFPTLDTE